MRNLKRFLALALTMLMVIGSFSLSAKSFPDTAEMTADQINALDILSDLSIFLGKEDGTFGGAEEINRKEMAILASRIQTGEKFGSSYGENVTPFTDVVTDFEAILYASNMGIIVGYGDGTFGPNDLVQYQDVLTMIVRTLGYNLDAGYPSSYILKAKELGITTGVSSLATTPWTANVQRQQVAELLYNALFAVKANGTTAAEMFGIDTYVVTAMKDYNLTGVTCYDANGTRVVVQPLNADGTINDMYYHLPVAAFEEAGVEITLGASYRIASEDNLATVKSISMCPSIELADDSDFTAELYAEGVVAITGADGKPVTYKAVERYTQVYNTQGTKTTDNEIIVYNQRGYNWTHAADDNLAPSANKDKVSSMLTDAMGNLLDNDGYIVAYYMPELSHNGENATEAAGNPYYVYDDATGNYRLADRDDFAKVGTTQQANSTVYRIWTGDNYWCNEHKRFESERPSNTSQHKSIDTSSFIMTNKDDKYTAVAYDDDFDGVYDRLFFMYHTFGIGNGANGISPNSSFNPPTSSHSGYTGSQSPVIADTAVAQGELVRFYVDAARKPFQGSWQGYDYFTTSWATVVEKYETSTVSGLVTAVNGTKMTIGGKTYDIATMALHNFKEGIPYGKVNATQYIGQNVTAVLYDGGIVEIKGYSNTWIIFEDYTGLTTNGYTTALAFAGSSDMKNITIASIDGYFFMRNNYNIPTDTSHNNIDYTSFYSSLKTGGMYLATVDAYGYYHISTTGLRGDSLGANGIQKFIDNNAPRYTTIEFGKTMSSAFNLYNPFYGATWGFIMSGDAYYHRLHANAAPQAATNYSESLSDTGVWEWIIFDGESFITGKGFPTEGSTLKFGPASWQADVATKWDDWVLNPRHWDIMDCIYKVGNILYFPNGIFNGSFTESTSNSTVSKKSDLVYISAAAAANYSVDNTVPGLGGAGETLWGFRYIYSDAMSMTDGSTVKVATDGIFNYKLTAGFYYVINGVVDHKVVSGDDPAISKGTLKKGGDVYFKVERADKTIFERNLTYYKLYQMLGGGTLLTNTDGSLYVHADRAAHNKWYGQQPAYGWAFGDSATWNNDNENHGIEIFYFSATESQDCPIFISKALVNF